MGKRVGHCQCLERARTEQRIADDKHPSRLLRDERCRRNKHRLLGVLDVHKPDNVLPIQWIESALSRGSQERYRVGEHNSRLTPCSLWLPKQLKAARADAWCTRTRLQPVVTLLPAEARKVLGRPKICKLAHAFLWEHSYTRQKLAQLLGQLLGQKEELLT